MSNNTFVSLLLTGPSKKDYSKDVLRGCIRRIEGRLVHVKAYTGSHVLQLTMKYHGATDVVKNFALLSNDKNKNNNNNNYNNNNNSTTIQAATTSSSRRELEAILFSADPEWGTLHPLGSPLGIANGVLTTTVWVYEYTQAQNTMRRKKRRMDIAADSQTGMTMANSTTIGIAPHDRSKITSLSRNAPFLYALGLTNERGEPKPTKSAKIKQCQKFVEIVSHLIQTALVEPTAAAAAAACTTPKTIISCTDMGCGRGYLTFSLHHYLKEKYQEKQIQIHSKGIDMRPKLVKEMNDIATKLNMEGLVFEEGTIEDGFLPQTDDHEQSIVHAATTKNPSLDILIALHACDSATDDAIWYGMLQQSDIIVVAPCCHKQVRQQLDQCLSTTTTSTSHPLGSVLQHNVYKERMAEMVTDSIRALLLELANYQTQVFEFVGGEHTSKNVMITAVKRTKKQTVKEQSELRTKLKALATLHGVVNQQLAKWMNVELSDNVPSTTTTTMKLSTKKMPPL